MIFNKSIWVNKQNLKLGLSAFGLHGKKIGSVKQIVHDGDTLNTRLIHNLGVRFLGIDTPEMSFPLPGSNTFINLSDKRWAEFFKSGKWRENFPIGQDLYHHFNTIIGNGKNISNNHAEYAVKAEKSLVKIISSDLKRSKKSTRSFNFFMAFGSDFLDTYGRLLCYLNSSTGNFRSQKDQDEIKKLSYNERQLITGLAVPYFIWPNIQPFLSIKAFARENIHPKNFWTLIKKANKLHQARKFVSDARAANKGIFSETNPLKLMPFELRIISRKKSPDRYVVDLRDEGNNLLLKPEEYIKIPHQEDRLHIPGEFVPIFQVYGWVLKQ
jgi:endonuclease YncB( thermonuclease family)